jgi:hypothetical protein
MNYKKVGEISILQIKSCDNLTGLFTKSLPLATFDKCMKDIGICRLKDLWCSEEDSLWIRISYFLISIEKIYYLFYRNQVTLPDQLSNGKCYKFTLNLQVQMSTKWPVDTTSKPNNLVSRSSIRNRLHKMFKHMSKLKWSSLWW